MVSVGFLDDRLLVEVEDLNPVWEGYWSPGAGNGYAWRDFQSCRKWACSLQNPKKMMPKLRNASEDTFPKTQPCSWKGSDLTLLVLRACRGLSFVRGATILPCIAGLHARLEVVPELI